MQARVLLVIAVFSVVGLGLLGAVAASPSNATCTVDRFEATVREGRSTGRTYFGRLTLEAAEDGALSGTLTSSDGDTIIPVVGQADGHAINLAFDLGQDGERQQYLFAVGTLWNSFGACSGAMGGPFVGPQAGDSGEWSVRGG